MNGTLEERVTVLEFQVAEITDVVMEMLDDVTEVVDDVNLLESEQVLQDERILELEMGSDGITCFLELIRQLLLISRKSVPCTFMLVLSHLHHSMV